ncbi:MAG: FmdB family zinc ribbon protein [Gammaproteobacteria bacterium]|jgi:putative FmdB family regulatory protein|nr:FmdB family transcriptional regulator [Gammaproteobacteria bacterium]MDC3144821.1 zinc ribbon domain-containing protein [SAR86 cluster bacterium]|tara:strand:+ start:1788 stop:2057 length:270 start_codon:yes stop_codon:yes gene_type:complete
MPIYEFQCNKCGKRFEKILSLSESSKNIECNCPKKAPSKKVVSAPSFRLGGKGWYETDFKTGSKKNLVQSDKKDKKTTETPKKKENKDK